MIVIVDNLSRDDSVPELKRWMQNYSPSLAENSWGGLSKTSTLDDGQASGKPGIVLLEARENGGFSCGNNLGIRYALEMGATWILLLNNDTIVERGSLERLVAGAEGAGAYLAGCSIYEYPDTSRPWFLCGKFGWWGDRDLRYFEKGTAQAQGVIETDWITGCCILIHRNVLARIGLLDENSFLYLEDSDFCRRAAKAGFRRIIVVGTEIYHKGGRSAGVGSPLARYHSTRNRVYFHRKHYAFPAHAGFLLVFSLSRWVVACWSLLRGRPDLAGATLRGLWDGMQGKVNATCPESQRPIAV